MRLSFQACFIAISIVMGVNGDKSPPSCTKPYDKMTACKLICNMIHDSDANSAMKMLQTEMKSLTSVIQKSSSSQPGKKLTSASMFESFLDWRISKINGVWFFLQLFPLFHASNSMKNTSKLVMHTVYSVIRDNCKIFYPAIKLVSKLVL